MADDDWKLMNMASLRVAGVGGIGLVAVALVIASQYQMISGTLTMGAIGGLVGGCAVILYRRRRGPLRTAGDGPGGRRFLVEVERGTKTPARVDEPSGPPGSRLAARLPR